MASVNSNVNFSLPQGFIITDNSQKKWKVGKAVGCGSFGEIYLLSDDLGKPVPANSHYVCKIEPHANGPLFVEINYYIRNAKPIMIDSFMSRKNVTSLGVPKFFGSGSFVHKKEKYRFLVMQRFGPDLETIFRSGQNPLDWKTVFVLARRIVDSLEYIHSRNYVHADVKAQNLLFGHEDPNEVYLVDYGLASKYVRDGLHLPFGPDCRKAHDGTLQYTSRDAHIGAHSRRGDLETLAYNLVHWLSGSLPWISNLENPGYVQMQKNGFMQNVGSFLRACFGDGVEYPEVLEEFIDYVNSLDFESEPDYERCRQMFSQAMLLNGFAEDDGSCLRNVSKARKRPTKKKKVCSVEVKQEEGRRFRTISSSFPETPSPDDVSTTSPAATRAGSTHDDLSNWCWEDVLCSDPELMMRQARHDAEASRTSNLEEEWMLKEKEREKQILSNPTPAMIEIMNRIKARSKTLTFEGLFSKVSTSGTSFLPAGTKSVQQTTVTKSVTTAKSRGISRQCSFDCDSKEYNTPAMLEVIVRRSKRLSLDRSIPITPDPSDEELDSDDERGADEAGQEPLVEDEVCESISKRKRSSKRATTEMSTKSTDSFIRMEIIRSASKVKSVARVPPAGSTAKRRILMSESEASESESEVNFRTDVFRRHVTSEECQENVRIFSSEKTDLFSTVSQPLELTTDGSPSVREKTTRSIAPDAKVRRAQCKKKSARKSPKAKIVGLEEPLPVVDFKRRHHSDVTATIDESDTEGRSAKRAKNVRSETVPKGVLSSSHRDTRLPKRTRRITRQTTTRTTRSQLSSHHF